MSKEINFGAIGNFCTGGLTKISNLKATRHVNILSKRIKVLVLVSVSSLTCIAKHLSQSFQKAGHTQG